MKVQLINEQVLVHQSDQELPVSRGRLIYMIYQLDVHKHSSFFPGNLDSGGYAFETVRAVSAFLGL